MDDIKENFVFLCFASTKWCTGLKILWHYFGLSKWKPQKKLSTSHWQLNLSMPKLQAILKTLVATVCHRYERQFCNMFSWLFCFLQVKQVWLKREEADAKNVYTRVPLICFLPHFFTCDLGGQLLNRHKATWNLLLLIWYQSCTTEKCQILGIIPKLFN